MHGINTRAGCTAGNLATMTADVFGSTPATYSIDRGMIYVDLVLPGVVNAVLLSYYGDDILLCRLSFPTS